MSPIVRVVVVLFSLLLAACQEQPDPPASAPANFTVTPGENRVVLTWTSVPGQIYWVYYKKGSSVSTGDYDYIAKGITSPAVITGNGLNNDTEYAFIVAASNKNSKVGPATPVVTVTPRLVGASVPWTVGTSFSGNPQMNGVTSSSKSFVAVGDGATLYTAAYSYTSEGGIEGWVQGTLPVTAATHLRSVIYDGSQFVVLGHDGSILVSSNVTDWVARTAITAAPAMNALAYGSGRGYVAVGAGGAIYRNTSGGVTEAWTAENSGVTEELFGISYINGLFVVTGANGTLLTSPDGQNWTVQDSKSSSNLRSAAFGAGLYVVVGDAGAVTSSSDGVTWTLQSLPTTESLYSICFGPDQQFIAVGTTGAVIYNETGENGKWSTASETSQNLHSVTPGNVFMAVGAAGTNISTK